MGANRRLHKGFCDPFSDCGICPANTIHCVSTCFYVILYIRLTLLMRAWPEISLNVLLLCLLMQPPTRLQGHPDNSTFLLSITGIYVSFCNSSTPGAARKKFLVAFIFLSGNGYVQGCQCFFRRDWLLNRPCTLRSLLLKMSVGFVARALEKVDFWKQIGEDCCGLMKSRPYPTLSFVEKERECLWGAIS